MLGFFAKKTFAIEDVSMQISVIYLRKPLEIKKIDRVIKIMREELSLRIAPIFRRTN
jgi:hypothetical protein